MPTTSSDLEEGLKKRATVWASAITKESHANLGNKARLIRVRSRVDLSGGKIIVVSTAENIAVSEYGDVKNVARAYEYGSGIHGKRHAKYPIRPRRKKLLAFYWEKFSVSPENPAINSPKFVGVADDGRLLFRWVDHPGVEAVRGGQGYMRPAINKVRRQIRQEIPVEVRKAVLGNFKRAFKK